MHRAAQPRVAYASAFGIPVVLYLVAALLSIALVTAQSALSLLCMLVLFTAAAAKLWSLFSLARVDCQLTVDKARSFAGETLELRAHIDNDKLLPVWLQVSLPVVLNRASRSLDGSTGLLSYQSSRLRWQLTQLPRGVHTLGPVELIATDPLGFYSQTKHTAGLELIVYPLLVPLLPSALPRRDLLGLVSPDSQVEDPTYVQGVREYQAGRAARYIHWKASARVHQLVEKVFERSSHERVLFLLRAEHFEQDEAAFERALQVLAAMTVELERRGVLVGLATNCVLQGECPRLIRPGRAPGQLARMLEIMARAQPRAALELTQLTQLTGSRARTTLVFFSYQLDDGLSAWLRQLAASQQTLSVLCSPPATPQARVTCLDALLGDRGAACR